MSILIKNKKSSRIAKRNEKKRKGTTKARKIIGKNILTKNRKNSKIAKGWEMKKK